MEKNEGTADRVVRIVFGIVLLYVGAVQMVLDGILFYVVVLVALILLVTGITVSTSNLRVTDSFLKSKPC